MDSKKSVGRKPKRSIGKTAIRSIPTGKLCRDKDEFEQDRLELNGLIEDMLFFASYPVYPVPVCAETIPGETSCNALLPVPDLEKRKELNRPIEPSEFRGFAINPQQACNKKESPGKIMPSIADRRLINRYK